MSLKQWIQSFAVCLLAIVMLGANDVSGRFNRLGHEMICECGCGQILLECNHVGCPVSGPMIQELHQQLATGASDKGIMSWFANKYGATVLAAPLRGGFDDVAWITPYAVFILATLGTGVLVYFWKRRSGGNPPPVSNTGVLDMEHEAIRERIRRETEY
ncbi:MAG TPA: cytochrome c-type biogenesis protein CcmH [Edaphobacter sp.]|nr:cytochrome c-type biogenesis protein CcmH [Edaphobacter sp.]